MKYKLIDGTTITLAGVASYSTSDTKTKKNKPKHLDIDFDFDFDFDFDKMKEEKEKFKAHIKNEAKKFKEAKKQQAYNKEAAKESTEQSAEETSNYNTGTTGFDFADDIINGLGDMFNHFGANLEDWGKTFEGSMENFGVNLDKFGSEMDKFGSEIEKKVSEYTKDFENHWCNDARSDDYDTWELESLYNEIYNSNEDLATYDNSPNLYYKVDGYDLGTSMDDQLVFIGSHIRDNSPIPFAFVSKTLNPDKWLVIKLNKEEYSKDWMKKVNNLEELADYTVEQFILTRYFKNSDDQSKKKVKIYIPLKAK